MIIKGYIYTYLFLILVILFATLCQKIFNLRTIFTKKFIHITISFCYIIMYHYFKDTIHIIIPPLSFILINYISYKFNIIKAMDDEDNTPGIVYYPISVFIMALITYFYPDFYPYYGIGLFCMAFGDGFAPLVAGYLKSRKIYNHKTISGCLTVFIFSFIIALVFDNFFQIGYNLIDVFIISTFSTLFELIGKKGLDNIFLPIGVSLVALVLEVI